MLDEVKNVNYLTIDEVANKLDCSVKTARELIKSVKDVQVVKGKDGYSNQHLYNAQEVNEIALGKQQQQQLAQAVRQAETLSNNKSIEILGTAFLNKIDDIDDDNDRDDEIFDELYKTHLYFTSKMLAKVNKRLAKAQQARKEAEEKAQLTEEQKRQEEFKRLAIEKERDEYLAYKMEVDNLYIHKYSKKEMRVKVVKLLRKKAQEKEVEYPTYTINMYKKYDGIHCFPYRDNYKGYLDIIEARGHMKEFYEMVLHD